MAEKHNRSYGQDAGLSLKKYWNKNREEIANLRNWECKGECSFQNCQRKCPDFSTRCDMCATIKNYGRYMDYLTEYISKEISSITMDDIMFGICMLREMRQLGESTLLSVLSCLRGVFKYAHENGDAYDIFRHYKMGKKEVSLDEILCSTKNNATKKADIQKEQEKLATKPKSLNVRQIEKLVKYLWDNIISDGRLCLVALMLYCGVRPAEGRALLWGDIKSFIDYPHREMVVLYKIRDEKGRLKRIMKTCNAYRRIPIHIELAEILRKRRDFVISQLGTVDIDNLPICCFGNDYARPCKDWEVAMIAEEIFNKEIRISKEEMNVYAVEHVCEKLYGEDDGKELQHLSLYVLRKNFWTWMQALTTLSDEEKYVLMGHKLEIEKRETFNNEDRLWIMCQKLDKAVLSKMLHEKHLYIHPIHDNAVIDDRGIIRIQITEDMLKAPVNAETEVMRATKEKPAHIHKIDINLTSEEAGDPIYVYLPSELGRCKPEIQCNVWPAKEKKGINCTYANWLAHEKAEKQILQKVMKLDRSVEAAVCEFNEAAVSFFDAETYTSDGEIGKKAEREVGSDSVSE